MSQAGGQRPPANRMTLQTFKARLSGAKKGWSLLKKKRDALKARFQAMLRDIVETKLQVGQGLKDAAFSLAKSHWAMAGDDISSTVVERAKRPSVLCKLQADNIAGVAIPVFKMNHDSTKDMSASMLGIANGGAVINACRMEYLKALQNLVRLASLQTAFKTLDEEIKMTSRRVNALEYVLIPRIEDVCSYITQEMDEQSREEFFRVKKVVEKKRQKLAREKAAAEEEEEEEDATAATGVAPVEPVVSAKAAEAPKAADASPAGPPAEPTSAPGEKKKKNKKKKNQAESALDAPSALDAGKDDDVVF